MLLSVKQMSCIMFYKPTRNQTLPSRHEFTLAKLVFLFEKYKKIEIIHKKIQQHHWFRYVLRPSD